MMSFVPVDPVSTGNPVIVPRFTDSFTDMELGS